MIRIGVVNIDVSHPKAFATILHEQDRARYVAVYNDGFRGDDEVDAFVSAFGLEKRCGSVEELAQTVDVGFVQGCNWDKHLYYARPFIDRGKPVFIDKPIAGSEADCREIEALSEAGKVIYGSSSVRYAAEIGEFLARPADERGEIVHVYGTAGVDEFNYGVHIVEAIGGLVGAGARTSRFVGAGVRDGKRSETFTVSFEDGISATYTTFSGTWQPFHVIIMTTTGTFHVPIDSGAIYPQLLERICDVMEGKPNRLAPITDLTESVRIMLAGRLSRERGGEEVALANIPADDPGYDGDAFEKGYAAAAKKIYLQA